MRPENKYCVLQATWSACGYDVRVYEPEPGVFKVYNYDDLLTGSVVSVDENGIIRVDVDGNGTWDINAPLEDM